MTRIPGYYTVAELAELAGLTPNAIRWHCRKGNIVAEDTGRVWLIPTDAGDDFLAARPVHQC